jgi:hypothetical protein
MIDAADAVVAARLEAGRTNLERVGDHTLFDALRSLGYRASDLLQTNCIIWVEGPSDRIYILHWLHAVAPDLVEGVDFSIAFYGGALLARLSAGAEEERDDPTEEERDDPTLVDLWRINRRMWVVMDSDQGERDLKPAVARLRDEITTAGTGGTWITSGYTIENYVEPGLLEKAIRAVHPTVAQVEVTGESKDPLGAVTRADGQPLTRLDKVAIALAVCDEPANLDVMDLKDRVAELAEFIRQTPNDSVVPDVTEVAEVSQ